MLGSGKDVLGMVGISQDEVRAGTFPDNSRNLLFGASTWIMTCVLYSLRDWRMRSNFRCSGTVPKIWMNCTILWLILTVAYTRWRSILRSLQVKRSYLTLLLHAVIQTDPLLPLPPHTFLPQNKILMQWRLTPCQFLSQMGNSILPKNLIDNNWIYAFIVDIPGIEWNCVHPKKASWQLLPHPASQALKQVCRFECL